MYNSNNCYTYNNEVDLVIRSQYDTKLPSIQDLLYTGKNWLIRLSKIIKQVPFRITGFKEELYDCIKNVESYYSKHGYYPNTNHDLYNRLYYSIYTTQGTFNNVHYI